MNLLAFELATEACSVALWLDGEVRERFEIAPRRHAELALPWAEQLLADADLTKSQLDAVAVGRGPGAFTGVRLAIAIGQGIALALDRPIVPVSTLATLAAGLPLPRACEGRIAGGEGTGAHQVLASIDARMSEIYSATFELRGGDVRALGEETVGAPDVVLLPAGDDWYGRGTGFAACDGALRERLGDRLRSLDAQALPHASDLARLAAAAFARGAAVAAERVEPAYLRNNVALTLAQQQARRDAPKPM